MDLIVVVLAAMSGALIGSSTGIFLMYRKLRPVNAAELDALRTKVRTTEFDLNKALAGCEKLKKDAVAQTSKNSEEVIEKQRQLEAALAARELEAAHRKAAEHRIAELIAETDEGKRRESAMETKVKALEVKAAELEANAAQGPRPSDEDKERLAALHAQVETGGRQIQQLTENVTQLKAQAEELMERAGDAEKTRAAAETELKQHAAEAARERADLEAELTTERERLHFLTEQISELRAELTERDIRMQEERESAAKGMELLAMAQQNLSRVVQGAGEGNGGNGNGRNGHSRVEAASPTSAPDGDVEAEAKVPQDIVAR